MSRLWRLILKISKNIIVHYLTFSDHEPSLFLCTIVLDCGSPQDVLHADLHLSGTTFLHLTNYTCHPGYTAGVISFHSTQCTAEGNWEPQVNISMCEGKLNNSLEKRFCRFSQKQHCYFFPSNKRKNLSLPPNQPPNPPNFWWFVKLYNFAHYLFDCCVCTLANSSLLSLL